MPAQHDKMRKRHLHRVLLHDCASRLSLKPDRKTERKFFLLLDFPNELIVLICRHLNRQQDIANFSRCSRRLHELLDFELYRHNINHFAGSALVWATEKGKVEMVRKMLQYGADPTRCLDPRVRQPPLMLAISAGRDTIVNLILDSPKCRVDQSDIMGSTALSLAVAKNNKELVELLLRHGARGCTLPGGQNPLEIALSCRYLDIARLLLTAESIDVNFWFQYPQQPCLHHIVRTGSSDLLSLLLARQDLQVNITTASGDTALNWAALEGKTRAVEALLDRGACPHVVNRTLHSALFFAAQQGHDEIVSILLSQPGVDIDSTSSSGETPLMQAAMNGHESTVRLLLADGANVNVQDHLGRSLLSVAAESGQPAMVKFLLELDGVNPDHKNQNGETPLSLLAKSAPSSFRKRSSGRAMLLDVAQTLLSTSGVDADSKRHDGRTPLSFAAESRNAPLVKLLLAQPSVDPDSKDNDGCTPILYAATQGLGDPAWLQRWKECDIAVVRMLLNTGRINVNHQDQLGRTVLSYAAGGGCEALVRTLLGMQANAKLKDIDGRRPLYHAKKGLKYCMDTSDLPGHKRTVALLNRHLASCLGKQIFLCTA